MQKINLSLANLDKLDLGMVEAAFKQALKRVVMDLEDRPAEKKCRQISTVFRFAPVLHPQTGTLDEVKVEIEVFDSVPKRRTKVYSMKSTQKGDLTFHPDLPDEPDGSTLYDPDTGEAKE